MAHSDFCFSVVEINERQVLGDGKLVFEKKDVSDLEFLQTAYTHFEINYPKFFKMDNLCKTGFLAGEILMRGKNISKNFLPEQIGIILSTANSSLDTDLRYQHTVNEAPSPGLFVYTLPNVILGELSIRHAIKGESACFVFDIFDRVFQRNYLQQLFETGKLKVGISGWAEYYNGNANAVFFYHEHTSLLTIVP